MSRDIVKNKTIIRRGADLTQNFYQFEMQKLPN